MNVFISKNLRMRRFDYLLYFAIFIFSVLITFNVSSSRIKAQAEEPKVNFVYTPVNWETKRSSGFNWIIFDTGYIETGRQGIFQKGSDIDIKEEVRAEAKISYKDGGRIESVTRGVFIDRAKSRANYLLASGEDYYETPEGVRIPLRYTSSEMDIKGHKAFIHETSVGIPSYYDYYGYLKGSTTILLRQIGIESSPGSFMSIIEIQLLGYSISPSADGINPENVLFKEMLFEVESILESIRIEGTAASNSNFQQGEPRPCKAAIHLPADLKPGEVLSPSYTITDLDGSAPKGEIYPLLYINGVQAHSVVWDGNEAKIELQVSCQGQALSVTAIMPAYGSPPPSAGTIPSDGFDSVIPPYDSTPDGLSKIPLPENAGQAMAGLVIPGILSIILGILGQSGAAVAPSGGSGSSKAKAGSAYDFGDSRDYYEGQSYTFDDGKKYKIVNGEFVPTMGLRDGEVYTDPDGNRKIWIVGQPWYETDWRRQAATNGKIAEPADDTGQLEADNKGVSTKSPETAGNGEAGNADFGSSSEATTEASPEAGQPGGERPMQETIERGRDQAGDAAEGLKGAASHLKDAQGRIKQLQDSGKDLKGLVSDLGIDPKSQAAINATVDEFNKEMGGLSTRLKNLEGMCSSAQEYAEAVKEVLERGGRVIEAYNNMHENLPPYIPEGLRAGVSTYGAAAQAAGEAVDKYVRSLPHGDKLADAFQTGELGRETNQALLTGVENVTHQQGKIYDEVIQPIDQQMRDNPWLDLNRDVPRDELGTYQTARGGNLSTEEHHRNLANEGARARELKDAIDNRRMDYLKEHSPRDYERLLQEDLMEQRPAEFRYQGAKRIRERLRAGQPAYTEGELRQIEQSLGKEYAEWLQNQDYLRLPGRIDR